MAFKAPGPPRSCGHGPDQTGDVHQGVVLMDADGGARVLRLVSGESRRTQAGGNTPTPASAGRDARPSACDIPNVNIDPSFNQPAMVQASASFGSHYSSSVWDQPLTSSSVRMSQTSSPGPLLLGSSSRHPTTVNSSLWTGPTEEMQSQKAFPGLMSHILESGSQSSSKTKNNPQKTDMDIYQKPSLNTPIAVDTQNEMQNPMKSEEFHNVSIYPFSTCNTAFGEPSHGGDKITTTVKKEKEEKDWSLHSKEEAKAALGNQEAERKVSETFQNLCVICGAKYRTKGGLHSHTIYKHSDERPFRCELCGASFKVHSKLTRHKVEKHCDDRPYICPVCGVSFKRKDKLGRHKRTLHTGDRPFVCRTCGKAFKRREVLRHHESKHYNGDRLPYECLECRKRFGRKDKINAHMRKVHGAKRSVNLDLYSNEFSPLHSTCS
ncbi:uncharacterized protein LOC144908539 [Branchiostoma floridae x Branchiostoma belcheri]